MLLVLDFYIALPSHVIMLVSNCDSLHINISEYFSIAHHQNQKGIELISLFWRRKSIVV